MVGIELETIVERHPDAAYREVGGAAVIVMPRDAKVLTLNRVGTHVWNVLDGRSVEQIVASVTERFEVEAEPALADTLAFLQDLRSRGLVVVRGG